MFSVKKLCNLNIVKEYHVIYTARPINDNLFDRSGIFSNVVLLILIKSASFSAVRRNATLKHNTLM